MNKVMVVSPHPDDETLGCGGALLKHKNFLGDEIHWLIVTNMLDDQGFSCEQIKCGNDERKVVANMYDFSSVHNLNFPAMRLDAIPMVEIIKAISDVFKKIQPNIIYLPYRGDIHTDHKTVFDAVSSCTKCFRFPFINKIIAYETLSETNFALNPDSSGFNPNLFINISEYLQEKLLIAKVFAREFGEFPFPRSEEAIRSLAAYRGVAAGCIAAEAFMILKEIA